MNTVAQVCKYGFKLDSLKNPEVKVDKRILSSDKWNTLCSGSVIEITGKNERGFVTDFKITGQVTPIHSKLGVTSSKPYSDDDLKRDCLLIVFLNTGFNLEDRALVSKKINLARGLYDELKAARFKEW